MKPSRTKNRGRGTPYSRPKSVAQDPVAVFCRMRPAENSDDVPSVRVLNSTTIQLIPPDSSIAVKNGMAKELQYTFKKVFDDQTSQKEIFDHVAKPLVQDLIAGKNGLLFTYGITSSGKTYTMMGVPRDAGILPRSMDVVFNTLRDQLARKFIFKPDKMNSFDVQSGADALLDQQKEMSSQTQRPNKRLKKDADLDWSQRLCEEASVEGVDPDCLYGVFVSYVEIYNNLVYDLLDDSMDTSSRILREDAGKRVYVFGTTEVEVRSAEEAMEVLSRGQIRRRVATTTLNAESSRSHSVFSIRVVRCPLDCREAEPLQDKNLLVLAQLCLVDLAGSERTARTGTMGHRLKEASNINNSLMSLRTCIEILRENQMDNANKMVPYRESKLTHLFKSYFEGEGSIKMVVCINPKPADYDETIHVMKFAELTQEVLVERAAPPPTPQLHSGRVNRYRETARRVKEDGGDFQSLLSPTVYSLGPAFPEFAFEEMTESQIDFLIEFMEQRQQRRQLLAKDLALKRAELRKSIQETEKENLTMRQQTTVLQMNLDAREIQVRTLEKKLSTVENSKDMLLRKADEYEQKMRNLENLCEEKDRQIKQFTLECNKLKNKFQDRLAMERDRMNRIMEYRLAEKQAELESQMCLSKEKIRQLRDILNAGDNWELPEPLPSSATVGSETRLSSTRGRKSEVPPTAPPLPGPSSGTESNARGTAESTRSPRSGGQSRPVANPRHRRSCSAGAAVWVDHRPPGSLEMGTVFQSQLKKRKSVSKLQIKDFTGKDSEKYVLTHQEQDSQGEIETHLFKGDVIPSVGGGAQVIFNDVETLKQTSPVRSGQKRSYATPDVASIRADIESRCAAAVEGRPPCAPPKKVKH